jgi:hypothetical protein
MTSHKNEKEYFLSKIEKRDFDNIDLMGLNVAILYSRNYFVKNQDINSFLQEVYEIEFLPYVMKSRTLIVARITKEINKKSPEELKSIRNKMVNYLNRDSIKEDNKKNSKKKDANEKMKSWLEGL